MLFLASCGADREVEIADAIEKANICLSSKDCDCAINTLELLGRQNTNADYLKTLAAGYACKSGYTSPNFFSNDLGLLDSSNLLGSMTSFSTSSSMDAPDNEQYGELQKAIDILIYAGGLATDQNPTPAKRSANFSATDAGDINSQLLFMMMAQLGKYFFYYGDASGGIKAAGSVSGNLCLADYDDGAGIEYDLLDNTDTGACVSGGGNGHPDFGAAGSLNVSRMCEGIVLFNNFLDTFPSVIAAIGGSDFDELSGIETTIDTYKTNITDVRASASDVVQVTSQAKCEADNAASDAELQVYFVFIFELLFL
jgi:hypothetical protein